MTYDPAQIVAAAKLSGWLTPDTPQPEGLLNGLERFADILHLIADAAANEHLTPGFNHGPQDLPGFVDFVQAFVESGRPDSTDKPCPSCGAAAGKPCAEDDGDPDDAQLIEADMDEELLAKASAINGFFDRVGLPMESHLICRNTGPKPIVVRGQVIAPGETYDFGAPNRRPGH